MSRNDTNKYILDKVADMVEKCPDMRFIQLLWALGIVNHEDRFYEESVRTKEIVDSNYNKLNYVESDSEESE